MREDSDSEMYDTSKKARTPSWCDRILVKSDSEISLEEYTSLSCPLSDHRVSLPFYHFRRMTD